jgi:hypothetical protein
MKKYQLLPILFLGFILVMSSAKQNPANPPTGNTGAPGETTCAKSGCHAGGTYAGSVTITGLPDTVVANMTYPITITNTSNAVRAGFQMTCMQSTDAACGTFTTAAGVNIGTGSGRQYPRQSTPKALSGGSAAWTFDWKAPATLTNPQIRFYFSTLCANGNGNTSGDNVLVGADTVVLRATSANNEPITQSWYQYEQQNNQLRITLTQSGKGQLEIFGLNGMSQMTETLASDQLISTGHLPSGIYIAKVAAGGKMDSFKFFIGN